MAIASYSVTVYYETVGGDLKEATYSGAFIDMNAAVKWSREKVENDKRRRCRRVYRTHGVLVSRF